MVWGYIGLHRGYIGIMEQKMETTIESLGGLKVSGPIGVIFGAILG